MLHYNGLAAEAAQQALGGGPLRGLTKQSPLPGGIRAVLLGLYPIATFQYISTDLYQIYYHIQ